MELFKGPNIKLRALEPGDIDLLYQWENDTKMWCLSNSTTPFSKFYLEQFILNSQNDIYADKQLRLMAEAHRKNNDIAGCIDIFDFDPKNLRAGIGILIDEKFRSQGYGSEILDMVLEYGCKILNLKQFYCNISADNSGSLKLFKNKGFEIAGLKKQWIKKDDYWIDEYILQLMF